MLVAISPIILFHFGNLDILEHDEFLVNCSGFIIPSSL